MSAERHQRIGALFLEARTLLEAERPAFLDSECGDDAELRAEVESLLANDQSGPDLEPVPGLDVRIGATDLGDRLAAPATTAPPPERIDRYRILEEVGEGGFGTVYLAEQTEPIVRRVALKIIKPGMDTRKVIARFEAERQALAMMDHPWIASVLDAGATDTGHPYFVMEFVNGVPITEFCDGERLSTEERLRLFVDVCAAVQHAHQKGIIHRDLKPSNVLVSRQDGRIVPKVIDFGIAKASDPRPADRALLTDQPQLIGTLEYMSPEQADLGTLDIDTRSDVYSLGVMLYELLTGTTPLDGASLRSASLVDVQQMIRDEEPPRPSTRLSTMGEEAAEVARRRQLDPERFRRVLAGDLDWIVMRALEKDRSRRYDSASEFAADIGRHLSDEPVIACPPSAGYRLRKLVRRNRRAVLAMSAVFVVLVLGLAGTSIGLAWALNERDRADENAGVAERRAEISQAVNHFLNQDLLAAVAPSAERGRGRDVPMREVLDQAARRIEDASRAGGRFADKPAVEAAVRSTLGQTYRDLGHHAIARPHVARALELRTQTLGEEHPDTLRSMNDLATVLVGLGEYAEAETLHDETLAMRRRLLGETHADTLDSMSNLATTWYRQGRFAEARLLFEETLDLRRGTLGPEHGGTLDSMNNLAMLHRQLGRYSEAEALLVPTLDIRRRNLGREHPRTLDSMAALAIVYSHMGRHYEAEELMQEGLAIERQLYGDDHPQTLKTMNNLAAGIARQQRFQEAADLHKETLAIRQRSLGDEHPDTLSSMSSLVAAYLELERFEAAEDLLGRTIETQRRVLGAEHQQTLWSEFDLANLYRSQGRDDDCEAAHRRVLEKRRQILGNEHPDTVWSMQELVEFYLERERPDDARPLERERLGVFRRRGEAPGASADDMAIAAWMLVTCKLEELRDPEAALALSLRSVEIVGPEDHRCLTALSMAYHVGGHHEKAVETQREVVRLMPADDRDRANQQTRLAEFESALESARE